MTKKHHSGPSATTDHEEVRAWIEARGGQPVIERERPPALMRIGVVFADSRPRRELAPISWDEFFDTFERQGLAFVREDNLQSREHRFRPRSQTERGNGGSDPGQGKRDGGEEKQRETGAPQKSPDEEAREPSNPDGEEEYVEEELIENPEKPGP